MKLELIRSYLPEGTNGCLYFDGKLVCKTIELPWKDNERQISCVPEGEYRIKKRFSNRFKWHFEILGVRSRDLILIHPANDAVKELRGCIAPVTAITGEGKGSQSRMAFNKVKELLYPYLDKGSIIKLNIITNHEKNYR